MIKEPLVYIIVLNWNGFEDTKECLESVEKIIYRNYKIALIDNGSESDDFAKLKNFVKTNKKIKLIRNKENLGFTGGVNQGMEESIERKAKYSLLLNNDAIVDKNFLSEMVKVGELKKEIGVVGNKIYYFHNPKKLWASGAYFNYYFPPLFQKL